jgi:hypothetical protein
MNFLLRNLQSKGVMHHNCIAFQDDRYIKVMMERFPDRTVMHMGDDVRPGPYWAVHARDVESLVSAGYKVRVAPKTSQSLNRP